MGWKQRPDLNPISGDLQEQWKGICRKEVDTSEFIAVKQDREAFVPPSAAGGHNGTAPLTAEDPNLSGVSDHPEKQGKANSLHVIFLAASCFSKNQF